MKGAWLQDLLCWIVRCSLTSEVERLWVSWNARCGRRAARARSIAPCRLELALRTTPFIQHGSAVRWCGTQYPDIDNRSSLTGTATALLKNAERGFRRWQHERGHAARRRECCHRLVTTRPAHCSVHVQAQIQCSRR